MKLYRISACKYIKDLGGTGAYLKGGRWNSAGVHVLYAAESSALAMLEALAHITMIGAKQPFCLIRLQVPNDVEILDLSKLPGGWNKRPEPDGLKLLGDDFIARGEKLALRVPSVLVPDNFNYLVNPQHPLAHKIKMESVAAISFDKALLERQ
jgi:RES domain-containing protein